jgi:hypothetical protein
MNKLFRHYTAEHQLIEEDEEEVYYTYQSRNKEMYYASENIYVDVIIDLKSVL